MILACEYCVGFEGAVASIPLLLLVAHWLFHKAIIVYKWFRVEETI